MGRALSVRLRRAEDRINHPVNLKPISIGAALAAAFAAVAGLVLAGRSGPRAPVTVRLRLEVAPPGQIEFVIAQANSARFKYEMGQKAGVRPVLAQRLSVKRVPDTSRLDLKVDVGTPEEGRRYADAAVEMLQSQCGEEVRLTLTERRVR
jgi:hypothetical protein